MNVLIVEPSKLFQTLLRHICAQNNARIKIAANGTDALGLMQRYQFDVVCVSHELGDMNSTVFLKSAKKAGTLHRVPVQRN